MIWGMEEKQQLRQFWKDGLTASEIAKKMGHGLTRNAVIGAAHRLKLPKRESPIFNKKPEPKKMPPQKIISAQIKISETEPESLNVSMLDIKNNQCRYPHGDPRESNFALCGHPIQNGSSYCQFHNKLCQPYKARPDQYKSIPAYFKTS